MTKVSIYVEGAGPSKEQQSRCREAFSKLFVKAGFRGRMPRVIPSGSRSATFDDFKTAARAVTSEHYPILLVDSEDVVTPAPWDHLRARDGWERPNSVADDQAQLMVVCMETWVMADQTALRSCFGASLQASALLPVSNLEQYSREDVQQALEHATRNCGRDRTYRKGNRSFRVVGELDPHTLMTHLPHFKRLIDALDKHLPGD